MQTRPTLLSIHHFLQIQQQRGVYPGPTTTVLVNGLLLLIILHLLQETEDRLLHSILPLFLLLSTIMEAHLLLHLFLLSYIIMHLLPVFIPRFIFNILLLSFILSHQCHPLHHLLRLEYLLILDPGRGCFSLFLLCISFFVTTNFLFGVCPESSLVLLPRNYYVWIYL